MKGHNIFSHSLLKMAFTSRYLLAFFIIGLLVYAQWFNGRSLFINNLGSIQLNRALLADSNEQTANEHFTKAGLQFQQALTVDRDMGYAHYNLGTIYTHFGDAESAFTQYEKAVEILKTDVVSQFQLGMARYLNGDEYGAISLWQEADATAFFMNRAQLNMQDENIDDALQDIQMALAINPSSVETYHMLGKILSQKRQYSDALQAYQSAIELDPSNPISLYYTGLMYERLDQLERARNYYELTISENPRYFPALKGLAEFYAKQEKCEQAEAVLQPPLTSKSTTTYAITALRIVGTCYLARQNPDKALAFLEPLVSSETPKSTDFVLTAQAYESLGRIDDAIFVYDYVLIIDPENESAQLAKSRLTQP